MASKSKTFKDAAYSRLAKNAHVRTAARSAAHLALRTSGFYQTDAGKTTRKTMQGAAVVSLLTIQKESITKTANFLTAKNASNSFSDAMDALKKKGTISTGYHLDSWKNIKQFQTDVSKYFAAHNVKNLEKMSVKRLNELKDKFKDDENAALLLDAYIETKKYSKALDKYVRKTRRGRLAVMATLRAYTKDNDVLQTIVGTVDTAQHAKTAIRTFKKVRVKAMRARIKRLKKSVTRVKKTIAKRTSKGKDAGKYLQKKEKNLTKKVDKIDTKLEKSKKWLDKTDPREIALKKLTNKTHLKYNRAATRTQAKYTKAFSKAAKTTAKHGATSKAALRASAKVAKAQAMAAKAAAAQASVSGAAGGAATTAGGIAGGIWILIGVLILAVIVMLYFMLGAIGGEAAQSEEATNEAPNGSWVSGLITQNYLDDRCKNVHHELIQKDILMMYAIQEDAETLIESAGLSTVVNGYWNPQTQTTHSIDGWNNQYIKYTDGSGNEYPIMPDNLQDILAATLIYTSSDYKNLEKTFSAYAESLWTNTHVTTITFSDVYSCPGCLTHTYLCNDATMYENAANMHLINPTTLVTQTSSGCSEGTCPGHSVTVCLGHVDLNIGVQVFSIGDTVSLFDKDVLGAKTGDNLCIASPETFSWYGWDTTNCERATLFATYLGDYDSSSNTYWDATAFELTNELDRRTFLREYTISQMATKYTPAQVNGVEAVYGYWDPSIKDYASIGSFTSSSRSNEDGAGNEPANYIINTGDILCMALMFTGDNYPAYTATFKEYCRRLWEDSHTVEKSVSALYSCEAGCLTCTYKCNDADIYNHTADMRLIGTTLVPYSSDGCTEGGGCAGHELTCCTGHVDLNIKTKTYSLNDATNSIFAVDSVGNNVGTGLYIVDSETYNWDGWTDSNKDLLLTIYNHMW